MSRQGNRTVRLAVALLPKHSRGRYSEQWTGELRDAAILDIPESEISNGALRFAVTVQRPMPRWFRATSPRMSVALAFSTAIVSLSEYATLVPVTDGSTFTQTASIASTPLIAWVLIVPLLAFIMAMASRTASRRERAIVTLLAVASYLPFLRTPIDNLNPSWSSEWLTAGSLTYAVGGLLLVLSAALAWGLYRQVSAAHTIARPVRLRRSIIAGVVFAALVTACSFDEFARWASRKPPLWVEPITKANRAEHAQWLVLKTQAELMISQVLTIWVVVGIALALAIIAFGFSRRATLRRTIALAAGLSAMALISYGGLVMFLQIMSLSVAVIFPVDAVELIGRLGIIGVLLFSVSRGSVEDPATPAVANVRRDLTTA
jgi:hypothetical protein